MLISRKTCLALLSILFLLSACSSSVNPAANTATPRPKPTANVSAADTPLPPASRLKVEKESLRGANVRIWHPWFGAEASLLDSQVSKFNQENEWGITVSTESKSNYNELFSQTEAAFKNSTNPQIVIAFPEHALAWGDHVLDLTPYVSDPTYGLAASDVSDFPQVIWKQDEVDGKRFGVPAQRTARFLLYNQSWARELGFDSPPLTASDFEKQACAAHSALGKDVDPQNDALGGWLIDTNAMTPLSWLLAFGGGVQEEEGYRFLTPANLNAFRFVKTLQQKSCAWVPSADLPVADRFAKRQALFATASLEDLPDQSRALAAANNKDEWTVLAFPGDQRQAFVVYGSSFVVFQSDDVTQLASWLFLRWILAADNQARWVQSTGLFPLRNSTMNSLADYAVSHPQWAAAVKLLPQGDLTPQLASWRSVRVMLGDGFADMFDTIRHPDLTEGQVPILLRQMESTAEELNK